MRYSLYFAGTSPVWLDLLVIVSKLREAWGEFLFDGMNCSLHKSQWAEGLVEGSN